MSTLAKTRSFWTQYFPPSATFTEASIPNGSQKGRVFIVTGGNAGIGYELCKILYASGATIYMGARTTEKAEAAIISIEKNVSVPEAHKGTLKTLLLDLDDLRSVRDAAHTFTKHETKLDVLWNNAGMGPNRVKFGQRTAQGIEPLLGVHCVAGLYLSTLLLPQLKAAAADQPSRVLWTTSGFAETNSPDNGIDLSTLDTGLEDRILNYAASKAGVWILAREFARRCNKDGVISLAVNPGNVLTGSYQGTGPILMWFMATFLLFKPVLGAYTQLFAGLSPQITPAQNGLYIIPWGRIRSDDATVRLDILKAAAPEQEGGLGYGIKLWTWCEKHWENLPSE